MRKLQTKNGTTEYIRIGFVQICKYDDIIRRGCLPKYAQSSGS